MSQLNQKNDFALEKIISMVMTIAVVIGLIYAGISITNSNKPSPDSTNQTNITQSTTPDVSKDSIFYDGESNIDALTLLKRNHQVESTESSFGSFVSAIDGKTSDPKTNYWQLLINEKPSDVAADKYITNKDDKIEWRLTPLISY